MFCNLRKRVVPEKLFVLIGTYHHESFISRAIQGVLDQEVDLPFQILVRDDASADNTASIVAHYARQHPDKVVPIFYGTNQYSLGRGWVSDLLQRVAKKAHFVSRERVYVALCEGDDFWIDPTKLQRQVDFLRENPNAVLVHHGFQVITEEGGIEGYESNLRRYLARFEPHPPLRKGTDLLEGNFIMTCAVMMRLSGWKPRERRQRPAGLLEDWVSYAVAARGKMVGYIDREMSVYRVHAGGIHSSRSAQEIADVSERSAEYLGQRRK